MSKGQITLPKDIRKALGLRTGDRVTLIRYNDQVIMMNGAVYAMKMLQDSMIGEAEKAGLQSDDDVVNEMLRKMRKEGFDTPNAETLAAVEDVNLNRDMSKPFHSVKSLMESLNSDD